MEIHLQKINKEWATLWSYIMENMRSIMNWAVCYSGIDVKRIKEGQFVLV